MAPGAKDARHQFSGKRGKGLTFKQFELMAKGSLLDRFKKLQKNVGNPVDGAMFKGRYCIYLREFLGNPAKVAHEQEYDGWCREKDPIEEMFKSLRRHFENHKEGRAHEWTTFWRESGEELPAFRFRLQNLARDLGKDKSDQELMTKFVTSLDKRLAEETSAQAMAATEKPAGAYILEKAYEAGLQVQAVCTRLRIARELAPRETEAWRPRAGVMEEGRPRREERPTVMQAVRSASRHSGHTVGGAERPRLAAAGPVAGGGLGPCHNCGETGHYKSGCPYLRRNSSGVNTQQGRGRVSSGGALGACFVCGQLGHRAAQCPKRVSPPEVAAAAAAQGVGGIEVVDAKEFRAFQEWRSAVQAPEGGEGWEHGECALGQSRSLAWRAIRSSGWRPWGRGQGREGLGSKGALKGDKEGSPKAGAQQAPT
jgi:hypothetical protein